jgi:CheY-like chemotaxis protein
VVDRLRLLVVDDDADLRTFVETVLASEQIEACFAADGGAALALLESRTFDLMLTDVRMPAIDGYELARRARLLRPELRVLFMSGYANDADLDPARDGFVPKPFRPRELLGCIYEIAGRRPDRAGPIR